MGAARAMLSGSGSLQKAKEARERRMAEEQQPPELPKEDRAHVNRIRQLLNSKMRMGITDGRVISGTLLCVDEHANLILDRAQEEREGVEGTRMLSSVMVPG